jgi:glutaredoxin
MIDLKKWSRQALKDASTRLLDVADRADERGGEIRDQIKEKLRTSRRLAELKKSLTTSSTTDSKHQAEDKLAPATPSKKEPDVFSYGDARKAAQVFGARSCSWSGRSLRLFESAGVQATYLDLDHPGSGPIREELRKETGQHTVPYIYLRGQFIGGFNALDEIHRLGQLPYLLLTEAEREQHPDHGKIEIAPRKRDFDFEEP